MKIGFINFLFVMTFYPLAYASTTPGPDLKDPIIKQLRSGSHHNYPDVACIFCHSSQAIQLLEADAKKSLFIDLIRFRQSIHFRKGKTVCIDCHRTHLVLSSKTSQKMSCFYCHPADKGSHAEARDSLARSVHAKEMRGQCGSCHNPHYMKTEKEMSLEEANTGCVKCHQKALPEAHSWHKQASLHLAKVTCISCHTEPSKQAGFKHEILPKNRALKDCAACHSESDRFEPYMNRINKDTYISGKNKNKAFDYSGLALIAFTAIGVTGHGLLRALSFCLRRRKDNE